MVAKIKVCVMCGHEHHTSWPKSECDNCGSYSIADVVGVVNDRWFIIQHWKCKGCGLRSLTLCPCPKCHLVAGVAWTGVNVRFRRGQGGLKRFFLDFSSKEGKGTYEELAATCK